MLERLLLRAVVQHKAVIIIIIKLLLLCCLIWGSETRIYFMRNIMSIISEFITHPGAAFIRPAIRSNNYILFLHFHPPMVLHFFSVEASYRSEKDG